MLTFLQPLAASSPRLGRCSLLFLEDIFALITGRVDMAVLFIDGAEEGRGCFSVIILYGTSYPYVCI